MPERETVASPYVSRRSGPRRGLAVGDRRSTSEPKAMRLPSETRDEYQAADITEIEMVDLAWWQTRSDA